MKALTLMTKANLIGGVDKNKVLKWVAIALEIIGTILITVG